FALCDGRLVRHGRCLPRNPTFYESLHWSNHPTGECDTRIRMSMGRGSRSKSPSGIVRSPFYSVQVLLPQGVTLQPAEIMRRLREWRGDIEQLNGSVDRLTVEIPTNDLPLLVNVFRAPLDAYAGSLHEALIWSPAWPACRGALMRCQASV